MRGLRLVAVVLALLIAAPVADAQVWKPRSRTHAKQSPPKTRKPAAKKMTAKKKAKAKPVAKKKKRTAKKKHRASDDDFTIIEEDFPAD